MNGNLPQPIMRYMPGLDGLRALSVIAVIFYHLHLKWAQGGFIGVGIFFVLSGYLITDQLLIEWNTNRRVSLVNFWIRRIKRLLPGMVGMLLFVALWLLVTDSGRLQALKGDVLSSVAYVNNWYLIFHHVSYFESFGPPSPIGHLWSLSIEEQFYVLWPLALLLGIRIAPRRGKLLLWVLGGALLSALAMAIIYVPGTDPSRVYYGTDTRAFALLVGAALAVIWPSWKLSSHVSSFVRNLLDICGGLGILALLLLMGYTNEYDDQLYQGGLLYVSLLTAVVIAALAHPAGRLGKLMGCKPLVWTGKRSYSLYIWHYPVIILTDSAVNAEDIRFLPVLLQITASFILAALSYRFIEEPVRRGTFQSTYRQAGRIAIIVFLFLIILSMSMYLERSPSNAGVPL
ncbi:acyltransferase family protein [Paenibacillus sp. CN-4]|uniref:acyltransferase family protein n=1 Tax=Paenibacillus nanchangensis TaxID=3348343 RepID=UPI00397889BD